LLILFKLDSDEERVWPPDDPTLPYFEEAEGDFKLADSPWTFENGGVNPDLQPSNTLRRQNTERRRRRKRQRKGAGYSNFPPYHPDYQGSGDEGDGLDEGSESTSSAEGALYTNGRVRRGSEGLEFKPADREDMLHRYLEQIGETPGRYHKYIPQVGSESEEEDDIPLGQVKPHAEVLELKPRR